MIFFAYNLYFRRDDLIKTSIPKITILILLVVFSGCINNSNNIGIGTFSIDETSRTFFLEDATEQQSFERLLSITLYPDGKAELATPPISSFMLPDCTYSVENDELLIQAVIYPKIEEMYGLKDGEIVARFSIINKNTLIFAESFVPLFADVGARYRYFEK